MSPPPSDEFDRITSAVLLKRHFPQPIGTHINIARPHNAMTALSGAGTRKYCSISKSAQSLEPKDRFPQINRQCLAIRPSEQQHVLTYWPHSDDADSCRLALPAHDSSSEYSCQRAKSSA
jgi:hypothetical protein